MLTLIKKFYSDGLLKFQTIFEYYKNYGEWKHLYVECKVNKRLLSNNKIYRLEAFKIHFALQYALTAK